MTLFNSANPRIAAAQAQVLETLANIPDEYGAVFVVDDHQEKLKAAVRDHHKNAALMDAAARLAELNARKERRQARHTPKLVQFQIKGAA